MNWLKAITKEKFISILSYINRLLFVLPVALVIYVALCLVLVEIAPDLLANYYQTLSIIDTILCVVCIAHAVKFYNSYLKTAQNCVWSIFFIILLDRVDIDQHIKDNYYYTIYWLIIVITALISAYDNANEDFKRYFTK